MISPRLPRSNVSRRSWLVANTAGVFTAPHAWRFGTGGTAGGEAVPIVTHPAELAARAAEQARPFDTAPAEALAARAVDAARGAGAQYAVARLTRVTSQYYSYMAGGKLNYAVELLAVSVQSLVDGYWGFASSPYWDVDEVVRHARASVRQAQARSKANDRGHRRVVELGRYPVVTGSWTTPIKIDPFSVPIEEKTDYIDYWIRCAARYDLGFNGNFLHCVRHERVLANTEGARITQTTFETGATAAVTGGPGVTVSLPGFDDAGAGWELFLDGRIPERLPSLIPRLEEERALVRGTRPAEVGRFTVVCSGDAMAALLDATIGNATQLDRALGYEANAGGTSYLSDPLGMLGREQVAASSVTVTADRSTPRALATVKWDDEGVEPDTATLIKGGILTDFQTTRESSAWLKEYYAKTGQPVRSHGFAAAESALYPTIQHAPNLALAPDPKGGSVDDLIASVPDGIYFENGTARADFQGITGLLTGTVRRIRNGRLGPRLVNGAVLFSTANLWKNIQAIGGPATCQATPVSPFTRPTDALGMRLSPGKGDPQQMTSRTITAPAAMIKDQSVINPTRRA